MLVDTRSQESWDQGHARGAIHMVKPDMAARIPAEYPAGTAFVVGPGPSLLVPGYPGYRFERKPPG